MQKDYGSFKVVEETASTLHLKLKQPYAALSFIGFRVLPWVIIFFCVMVVPGLKEIMPVAGLVAFCLLILGLVIMMLLFKYTKQIIFSPGKIVCKVMRFYTARNATTIVTGDTVIRIQYDMGFRGSSAWIFYAIQPSGKEKRIFHVPTAVIDTSLKGRDNFIEALKTYCGCHNIIIKK